MIFKKNGLFWKRRKNMKNAILAISEKKEILKQIRKELAEK
jgi:acetoacetate metabolism regulatory protein atoC